jgi:Flp pilus assembly protein TadG
MNPVHQLLRSVCGRASARFARARDGGAALDFAIVAIPFFLFLLAVIEIGYMFFLSVMIDNAALASARKVRTGQMQFLQASSEDFWEDVCSNVAVVAPCEGHLFLDVRTYADFANTRTPAPITNGQFDDSGLQVDFGEPGDIVLVRVYYIWDVFFPSLGTQLSNLNGGKRVLTSTVAFRNEPYEDEEGA